MSQGKFLIIGSGIAGSSLAYQLIKSDQKVTVIDSGVNFSSKVAAGMINPIVFRRMTKSWRVDEFIPFAEEYYKTLEKETDSTFFYPISIRRIFSSQQEKDFWLDKEKTPEFKAYLNEVSIEDLNFKPELCPFGTGRVNKASYVSTEIFLDSSKKWISENATFLTEQVDYTTIDPSELTFKGEKFDAIIFCEGASIQFNPWFSDIEINPTKGETLTIRSKNIDESESLNRKCFLLPIGDHKFRVGATYVWDTNNSEITSEGADELKEKLTFLTTENYDVIDQQAGVRPTTYDRRPIMGNHSEFTGLFLFNGLGTKGYMIAPLLAQEMVDYMLKERPLDKEVSLKRFSK